MTETDVGQIAALLALGSALYSVLAAAAGARLRRPEVVQSAARGVLATGGLIALMTGALLYALWTHDFAVSYVAEYSNLEVPRIFNVSSLWAGQAGSLMFWCLLLNIFAALVLWQNRGGRNRELMPWVMALMMGYQVFFLGLINFVVESPWTRLANPPSDGQGLMPLLGGNWAYNELGWGGYWAWDPVENVALMPWLTGTAFLHSILIQQRRGMLKVWNMALIIVTFCLTLFGTFMNRSGIESSVHAFETRGLGVPFVTLIAATLLVSFALVYWRLPGLAAANRLDSFFSRESAFLMNNLLLVGIAFAVFWGTVFPLLSQAVRGPAGKVTVGAPFFNRVTGPLFLLLLLFMAAGPLLSWRKASPENLKRNLLRPLAAAALAGVAAFILAGRLSFALAVIVCAAVIFTVGLEFYRGKRAKRRGTGYS